MDKKSCGTFTQLNTTHLLKKEGTLIFCNSMDGPGDYYAKWNKPVSERQILLYFYKLISSIYSEI